LLDVVEGVIYEDIQAYTLVSAKDVGTFFEDLRRAYETLEMVPICGELFEGVSDVGDGEDVTKAQLDAMDDRRRKEEIVKYYKRVINSKAGLARPIKRERLSLLLRRCDFAKRKSKRGNGIDSYGLVRNRNVQPLFASFKQLADIIGSIPS
jgi:hypothetical protein